MTFLTHFACATALMTTTAMADGHAAWTSVPEDSRIAFASIKSNFIGELHHFNAVSGTVSETGAVVIDIDLGSLETNIDIRNERMAEHVFMGGKATATLSGQVDMDALMAVEVGSTTLLDLEATLSFAGVENDIEAAMLVARLSEDRVLVTTADMILLATEDLEIDGGIDTLMELASLDGITRVAPATIRMVFER